MILLLLGFFLIEQKTVAGFVAILTLQSLPYIVRMPPLLFASKPHWFKLLADRFGIRKYLIPSSSKLLFPNPPSRVHQDMRSERYHARICWLRHATGNALALISLLHTRQKVDRTTYEENMTRSAPVIFAQFHYHRLINPH